MRRSAIAVAAFLLAAPALRARAGDAPATPPVRLALIEDTPTRYTLMLTQPVERVLREAGTGASLIGVDEVPCDFSGPNYFFRLPPNMDAPDTTATSEAAALEGVSEIAIVYPRDPELIAALKAAAADPDTFRIPNAIRLHEREAQASATMSSSGGRVLTVYADLSRPSTGLWRTGLAAYYRLRWKGRDAVIAVIGRTYGGLGRLGAAARRAAELGGPFTGLARGGTFGSVVSDAHGRAVVDALARAGLRYSAVDRSELEDWGDLRAYRAEPGAVSYLSANLVYSSAPAVSYFPPYAVFDASGTRVAVVGLTPPDADRSLPAEPALTIADPVRAVQALVPVLREKADVVVALGWMRPADAARLASSTRGLDLILADDAPFLSATAPPKTVFEQDDRPIFANPLSPVRVYAPALNVLDVSRRAAGDRADWTVSQTAELLDDRLNPEDGFPTPSLAKFAAVRSTEAALLPPARDVFPPERTGGLPLYEARDFWTLSAALLAEAAHAEAGLLPVHHLQPQTVGALREDGVKQWLGRRDAVVLASVPGSRLKSLADQAAAQARAEQAGLSGDGGLHFVVSGFDADGLLRGAPLDPAGNYLVATSQRAADALGLTPAPGSSPPPGGVPGAVLSSLRARAGRTKPARYRAWMTGAPVSAPGLWEINFRDISLNLRQTQVVRDDAFDAVQNSRVQGFNELLIGGALKTDAEYLHQDFKWTNTVEMEYAKSRLTPRNAPPTTNLAANRIMLLTLGTRRIGGIPYGWLAQSWGPSLGFQFDSEFESSPGLRRKQVYSAFPGVEFFDGSVLKSLEASGILKRDLSRDPPNTQSGLRLRALVSTPVGPSGARLDGEVWNNYFFLTPHDGPSDLRMEGDANAKLSIPIRRYLSVAPFVDVYWFGLKTRPLWGYNLMTGISIGFSRLWKPQYEPF
jgi:hypothetical protein